MTDTVKTFPPNSKLRVVQALYVGVDLTMAVLLLTGQLTAVGVFILPEGIELSVTGPMFGGNRLVGRSMAATSTIAAIDLALALLLILGQLRFVGTYVSSRSLFLIITGPPLGITNLPVVTLPGNRAVQAYREFRSRVVQTLVSDRLQEIGDA
ncbi:hypothetical protein D2Q93_15570 [Alicyclobacillaceae bacterium I2511]|nr:hypothetical protein D2Q93_15570 [Alicyclobacillaceae bacterium I2511]